MIFFVVVLNLVFVFVPRSINLLNFAEIDLFIVLEVGMVLANEVFVVNLVHGCLMFVEFCIAEFVKV